MPNGNDEQITIRKIKELVDHSEVPRVLGRIITTLLERPGNEQFICDLMKSLSRDEAELIKFSLETAKFIIGESFRFFEKRKEEYEVSLRWKRVFGFTSPARLSTESSDLAFRDMARVADYFSGLQQRMVGNVIDMRKRLTVSYEENICRLIEKGDGRLLGMPKEDVVKLENSCENLLNRIIEFEKRNAK